MLAYYLFNYHFQIQGRCGFQNSLYTQCCLYQVVLSLCVWFALFKTNAARTSVQPDVHKSTYIYC